MVRRAMEPCLDVLYTGMFDSVVQGFAQDRSVLLATLDIVGGDVHAHRGAESIAIVQVCAGSMK